MEDISRVIDYAVTLPYVDADRIGLLGICSGGGYAINATLTEKRIQAVVSISGVNVGRLFREGFSDYDPLGALKAMAAQRTLAWDAFAETLLTQPIMVMARKWELLVPFVTGWRFMAEQMLPKIVS